MCSIYFDKQDYSPGGRLLPPLEGQHPGKGHRNLAARHQSKRRYRKHKIAYIFNHQLISLEQTTEQQPHLLGWLVDIYYIIYVDLGQWFTVNSK